MRLIDEAEMKSRELTEREQIEFRARPRKGADRAGARAERAGIEPPPGAGARRNQPTDRRCRKELELVQAEAERRRAEITANQDVETTRITQERARPGAIERERLLDALNIAKRPGFRRGGNSLGGRNRAGAHRDRAWPRRRRARHDAELRKLEVARDNAVQIAEIQSAIEIATSDNHRDGPAAITTAEGRGGARKAVAAEEQAITAREREIAERRKETDLIGATRRGRARSRAADRKAEAEKTAATSFAEAAKIAAEGEAEAEEDQGDGGRGPLRSGREGRGSN